MTEKEKIFENIVKDYEKSECFSARLCPDQYVGKIADFKNEDGEVKEDFPVRVNIFAGQTADVCIKFSSYEKIMILVLESPHTDEFDKNNEAIGPANGTTGMNIRKYICDIFGKGYQGYHLVLMNAIPFQCSLGVGTEHFRYDVFQNAWADKHIGAEFCKKRLTDFLNALSRKNIVIVNACTKGYNAAKDSDQRPFLWHLVQNSIETLTLDEEKTIRYFRINHPSSWARNKKNREIKDDRQITFPKTNK